MDYSQFSFPWLEHFVRTPTFWILWCSIGSFILGRISKDKNN